MSKIYFRKDARKLLKEYLEKLPYLNCDSKHIVILKKVYHKIHDILKQEYPSDLADLINSYITDYMSFSINPHVDKVYEESDNYDISKTIVFAMQITGMNININFVKYNINFMLYYWIQVSNDLINEPLLMYELKFQKFVNDTMNDYDRIGFRMSRNNVQLLPFFNYYINHIQNQKCTLVDVRLSAKLDPSLYLVDAIDPIECFTYKNNVIVHILDDSELKFKSDYNKIFKMHITSHKRLKHVIIMMYKLINELSKSLIKYQKNENYDKLVRINKPINNKQYLTQTPDTADMSTDEEYNEE